MKAYVFSFTPVAFCLHFHPLICIKMARTSYSGSASLKAAHERGDLAGTLFVLFIVALNQIESCLGWENYYTLHQ